MIVYLCCAHEGEVRDLHRSLKYLYRFFNARHAAQYPVVVFHDFLTHTHIARLQDEVRQAQRSHAAARGAHWHDGGAAGLSFVPIDNATFSLPPSLAHLRGQIPRSIRGYGMGHRHMCRFFSAAVFSHPALRPYTYVWRLDTDSFLLGEAAADPFAQMEAAGATYGWVHAFRDDPMFVTGLWQAFARPCARACARACHVEYT